MKYLNKNNFSCEFPEISELILNDSHFKELCKLKPESKQQDKNNSLQSISFIKFFLKFCKLEESYNIKKSILSENGTFCANGFLNEMIFASEKLSHYIYQSSNINYEAENKICLLLYFIKRIVCNYCFYIRKSEFELMIKSFKRFKKYKYFIIIIKFSSPSWYIWNEFI